MLVFGNVLRQLDGIVGGCVAVLAPHLSNIITFVHKSHSAIDSELVQHASDSSSRNMSSAFVNFVISFADWFVCGLFEISLCAFR